MKKKGLAVLLAAVSCLAVPVTAMAEEAEQTITVNLTADPTYTVTIPSSVSMDQNGTAVDVVAEDVENLQEGQKISVTIAGTSYYRNPAGGRGRPRGCQCRKSPSAPLSDYLG